MFDSHCVFAQPCSGIEIDFVTHWVKRNIVCMSELYLFIHLCFMFRDNDILIFFFGRSIIYPVLFGVIKFSICPPAYSGWNDP